MVYLGADHRGFELKEVLKKQLEDDGVEYQDLGDDYFKKDDDYVDFASKVAHKVLESKDNKGILLCGSGVGVDVVANKIDGIRSALVYDVKRAIQSREHEDANIVSLPADLLDPRTAYEIVTAFLQTPFSGEERHVRRLNKIEEIEKEN